MKLIKLFVLILCIGLCIETNQAQAASFNVSVSEDAHYSQFMYDSARPIYITNGTKLKALNYVGNEQSSMHKNNTLVKFNFNDNAKLMEALNNNQTITSIFINIYQTDYSGTTNNLPNTSIYQFTNDWKETDSTITLPISRKYSEVAQLESYPNNVNTDQWVSADINLASLNTNTSGIYSFSLTNTNPMEIGNVCFNERDFLSKEWDKGHYAPYLTIETAPTPAPEPTSMLLGLMGVAGAARLRRKK